MLCLIYLIANLLILVVLFLINGFKPPTFYIFLTAFILTVVLFIYLQRRMKKEFNRTNKKAQFISAFIILIIAFIIHGVSNITGTLALKKTVKMAKETGIEFEIEKIIPPPVPDEKNAAIVYMKAFEILERMNKQDREFVEGISSKTFTQDKSISIKVSDTKLKKASALLFENPDFIELFKLVEKAVSMQECRFPVNYRDGSNAIFPHLSKIDRLSRICSLRTYLLARKGDTASAWKSFNVEFSLGDCLEDEPVIISQLVRFAIDNYAMNVFQKIFPEIEKRLSPDDFRNLISSINNKNRNLSEVFAKEVSLMGGYVYGDIFKSRYKMRDNFIPFIADDCSDKPVIRGFWYIYPSYICMPISKGMLPFIFISRQM